MKDFVLAAGLVVALVGVLYAQETAVEKKSTSVVLTLKVVDSASGLELEAKKKFPVNTNGFEAMSSIVQVKPKTGGFITDICGVHASGRDRFWALYVNGKFSKVGINDVKLAKNTVILWKTQDVSDFGSTEDQ